MLQQKKCFLREKPNKITKDCYFWPLAFKAAVKIKGDDDRSLKALLGKPQWRFLRPQEPLWDPHIAATFTNG